MGSSIEIREEITPFEFRLGFTVTGEERTVSVTEPMQHVFTGQDIRTILPMACPFLRKVVLDKFVCSVHTTRPYICRQYACFRLRILDANRCQLGKVADGSHYCQTSDPRLRTVWEQRIARVEIPETEWEPFVRSILCSEGYSVEG